MKLYLRTFGCRANQYDSEAVRAMVTAAGGTLVGAPEEADVALFNSCAVTADAVADLRQQVRRAARANPGLRSIVMGCAPGLAGETARSIAALPTVDALVAGADARELASALGIDPSRATTPRQSGARALLRIQDGCDEHCTFCATTLARGAHRSRPADALADEARALAEHHAEIVLTGVHIGGWGRERGETLGALVERLVRDVPRVRFRLTSIEATEVDDRLADLLAGASRRVAPHLHAPLQSGSDRMLRRMGRHWYTAARYAAAVERLARRAPLFALGADVIAGFPGEREEDHAATLALVRALPFTSLHVFPYSPRPGTAAERLPHEVTPRVARARAAELRALGEAKATAHRSARVGGTADVVAVGTSARRAGLTEDYLEVAVPHDAPGRFDATLVWRDGALVAEARHAVAR
ncbi:MAG TPA: MiaB/RimO family radical SAM methylthiotransferase [Gemmatimonadaceae bacterium]|nr:MiaB/RimO family radical SAM methylthiotransferase [Gemmatimonadaceae bacterium]